jgi:predicted RNA-binding protein (virulence factor B family)
MPAIGQRNTLRIVREAAPGLYLDGGQLGEILLPGRYIPKGLRPGAQLDVFLYRDSEDRLVATTETPRACVGEFAFLKVVSVHPRIGAFLDWGLSKDLLLPIREQACAAVAGEWVIAHVFLDPQTGRIVATTRLDRHLDLTAPHYADGQRVRLLIAGPTPLGFKAIVEDSHWGLLYQSELAGPLEIGQKLDGYVRTVRPDGKIDLRLDPAGYQRVAPLTERIIEALESRGGRLEFDDQSAPQAIRAAFNASKKAFKQALGALYRQHRIRFTSPGIELVKEMKQPRRPAR